MKKALIISCLINVIGFSFYFSKKIFHGADKPASPDYIDKWNTMIVSEQSDLSIDTNDIVFVGTSLTAAFPVTEKFGPIFKNRGIGGNYTHHILNRIDSVIKCHPQKIVLEAGINDVVNNVPLEKITANLTNIIDKIRKGSPATVLIVQSVTPGGAGYNDKNSAIKNINTYLGNYCKGNKIEFVDINSPLSRNGMLDSTYTADGIHLNKEGYAVWAHSIERFLKGENVPRSTTYASNRNGNTALRKG